MSAASSGKLRLIELVPAPVQRPHHGMRQGTAIALEMFERDLGVVSAVIEMQGGQVPKAHSNIRRERQFREVRPPEGRGDQKEASEGGPAYGF